LAFLSGHKIESLEEAIQCKSYNQIYGTNFQRGFVVIHITDSNCKKYMRYKIIIKCYTVIKYNLVKKTSNSGI